jgi:hypothetical protein
MRPKAQILRTFRFIKKYSGIYAGVVAILLFLVFKTFPFLSETIYRDFVYQIIRLIWDHSLSLLPFPSAYFVIPFLLIASGFYIVQFKKQGKNNWFLLPDVFGWFVFLFLTSWGFNYACRPSFEIELVRTPDNEVLEIGNYAVTHLNSSKIGDSLLTESSIRPDEIQIIQQSLKVVLSHRSIAVLSKPWAKPVQGGTLRKLGITGIYFPFSFEAHYDESLLRITKIFVTAHELAHAYGITDEGEADYVAFTTLMHISAAHPEYAYMSTCALIELLRTIRSRLHQVNPQLRMELDSMQHESINLTLNCIRENNKKHVELFPGFQSKMNDQYLKTMGVASGVQSYDRFIELVYTHFTWQ